MVVVDIDAFSSPPSQEQKVAAQGIKVHQVIMAEVKGQQDVSLYFKPTFIRINHSDSLVVVYGEKGGIAIALPSKSEALHFRLKNNG